MSLNRCELRVFDYIQSQVDEGHFWKQKVQKICTDAGGDIFTSAVRLEAELWQYYVERSSVVPAFRQAARSEGLQRTSMRNLAELFIRLWTEPKLQKKPSEHIA
jgi:hypothetical protein